MLVTTATIVIATIGLIAVSSVLLRRREIDFELVPNQLLTRKPIVFFSGDRSIFYFTRYWNQIPSFLTEHGFEVYKAPLPWKKGPDRSARIEAILRSWEKQNFSCHLFVDSSIFNEVSQAIAVHPSPNVTLNDVSELHLEANRRLPLYWHAHRLLTKTTVLPQHLGLPLDENLKSALLEYLKILAERDFTMPN